MNNTVDSDAVQASSVVTNTIDEVRGKDATNMYRLMDAFDELETRRILPRRDSFCCVFCGTETMDEEVDWLGDAVCDLADQDIGYVFYTEESAEGARETGTLALNFGGAWESRYNDKGYADKAVSVIILDVLQKHGLRAKRNDGSGPILVEGFTDLWRGRYCRGEYESGWCSEDWQERPQELQQKTTAPVSYMGGNAAIIQPAHIEFSEPATSGDEQAGQPVSTPTFDKVAFLAALRQHLPESDKRQNAQKVN